MGSELGDDMAGKASENIIILYSTESCSKCMLVKSILKDKIPYIGMNDTQTVLKKAKELGVTEMPILDVDNTYFVGSKAVYEAKRLLEVLRA